MKLFGKMSRSSSPELRDSIIATRERRANAGNRLRSLLDAQEPLEDDDIFMELEDDEDFEIRDISNDEEPDEEEEGVEEEVGEGVEEESENSRDLDPNVEVKKTRGYFTETGHDDENFSDSDESSIEGASGDDEEAGEKELQIAQREDRRRKGKANRKKYDVLPFMKPASKPVEKKPKPKKAVSSSSDLLSERRRSSKREAAIRNKHEVIQRLKEHEKKRINYVAPVIKPERKLTQAERLEEAKLTEKKNVASLNHFTEMEEARKAKQKAAMLARRVPMTSFIRYISTTKLVPPKRIFVRQENLIKKNFVKEENNDDTMIEDKNVEDDQGLPDGSHHDDSHDSVNLETHMDDSTVRDESAMDVDDNSEINNIENEKEKEESKEISNASKEQNNDKEKKSYDGQDNNDSNIKQQAILAEESQDQQKDRKVDEENNEYTTSEIYSKSQGNDTYDKIKEENPDEKDVKEQKEQQEQKEQKENTFGIEDQSQMLEEHEEDGQNHLSPVQGPWVCRSKNTISLLGFPEEYEQTTVQVKTLLFGKQSVRPGRVQKPKKTCVITGQFAKFIDPQTKVAFANLQAYKILQLIKDGAMAWDVELGGLYLGRKHRQRHAQGVPDNFGEM